MIMLSDSVHYPRNTFAFLHQVAIGYSNDPRIDLKGFPDDPAYPPCLSEAHRPARCISDFS